MLATLRGRLSVRQLQIMVDGLEMDRPLSRALGGGRWTEQDWVLHDIDTAVRMLTEAFLNVNRKTGEPPVHLGTWPTPDTGDLDEQADGPVDPEQAQIEAELQALMHSGG